MKSGCIFSFLLLVSCIAAAQSTRSLTLHFTTGSSVLEQPEKNRLDSMLAVMSKRKLLLVSVDAYCDSRGNTTYNQKLSEQRAQAVIRLLQEQKKDSFIPDIIAHGETDSLASNSSETGMQNNRSVMLRFRPKKTEAPKAVAAKANPVVASGPVPPVLPDTFSVGATLVLKNINFYPGMDVLLPQAYPTMKQLLQAMQKNPGMHIEIMGHVCCDNDYPLSLARARKIFNLLVLEGINPARLSYHGYSNNKPLVAEKTEEDRIQNRRVEIRVLKL